jgi:hypothetical protein
MGHLHTADQRRAQRRRIIKRTLHIHNDNARSVVGGRWCPLPGTPQQEIDALLAAGWEFTELYVQGRPELVRYRTPKELASIRAGHAKTRQCCSCGVCGNTRRSKLYKASAKLTHQERAARLSAGEQLRQML